MGHSRWAGQSPVKCWDWRRNSFDAADRQWLPPYGGLKKVYTEPSCLTAHPEKSGPASCTACPVGGQLTIIDPQTGTGVCTKSKCPFCKPKGCCDDRQKHYAMD